MSNENVDLFSTANVFLPLPTPSNSRSTLSAIENISATMNDNDLQRVPHSWMLMSSSPTFGSLTQGQTPPSAQIVQSTGRSPSMPSWRGYLPIKFEPVTVDQYQITSHFSQKVFLGGIPAELTEGRTKTNINRFVLGKFESFVLHFDFHF